MTNLVINISFRESHENIAEQCPCPTEIGGWKMGVQKVAH
jgi:hypothetical protein